MTKHKTVIILLVVISYIAGYGTSQFISPSKADIYKEFFVNSAL